MTKVRIEAGVCGHVTEVTASSEDGMDVTLEVETDCPPSERCSTGWMGRSTRTSCVSQNRVPARSTSTLQRISFPVLPAL